MVLSPCDASPVPFRDLLESLSFTTVVKMLFCAWPVMHSLGTSADPAVCAWSGRDSSQNPIGNLTHINSCCRPPQKFSPSLDSQGFCAWSGRDYAQNRWAFGSSSLCIIINAQNQCSSHHSQCLPGDGEAEVGACIGKSCRGCEGQSGQKGIWCHDHTSWCHEVAAHQAVWYMGVPYQHFLEDIQQY